MIWEERSHLCIADNIKIQAATTQDGLETQAENDKMDSVTE